MAPYVTKRAIGDAAHDLVDGTNPACEVWVWSLDGGPGFSTSLLNAVESERLSTFHHDIDRRRFLAGCAMARLFLANEDGVDPQAVEIDRTCPRCGGPHGKPNAVASIWQYSVSHSGRYVVLAFCRELHIGVDVEIAIGSDHPPATWTAVLTPGELSNILAIDPSRQQRAFLRYWTRKEAVLKCLGTGLTVEPKLLEVSGPAEAPVALRWPQELSEAATVSIRDLDFLPDHVSALAVQGPPVAVHAFEVTPSG
jgi:4'-phosphopantetheinyl transferase